MAINLEHFPTRETALRMLRRVSPIYGKSYVGKWLFEVMGMEIEEARELFEELRQQPFPERTTWAIEYWERRYAIIPKPTDDLETRRRNIIMKRSVHLPMNPARMEALVNGLTGGNTVVTENVEDYTFSVEIDGAALGMDMIGIIKEIKKCKPSHQTFQLSMTVQAKEDAVLRIGGVMASIVRFPLPALADDLRFEAGLHIGGPMGFLSCRPIPMIQDTFQLQSEIRTGGHLAAAVSLPLPPVPDHIQMSHTGRIGGNGAVMTTIPMPEMPTD